MKTSDDEAAVMSGGRSVAVAQFEAAEGRRARWILVLRLLVGIVRGKDSGEYGMDRK